MNSSLYSAHPDEKEVLLMEGKSVWVIGMEDVVINNDASSDLFWNDFNGKTITVIYLFTEWTLLTNIYIV